MNEEEWDRIDIKDIVYYFGEREIVCVNDDDMFVLEKQDEIPKTLKLEWVLFGEWYVRKKEKET